MSYSAGPQFLPGTLIAERYEVVRLLGKGGMGEVYEAKDLELNSKSLALKVIDRNLSPDSETFARFRNEVLLARELVHNNIVRIFDLGKTSDGTYFITMELVGGASLKYLIESKDELSSEKSLHIFGSLLEAVAYAHSQKIIHRDLKPANVVITDSGAVKLLDFGIAKELEAEHGLTKSGQMLGTPLYMSPEQIRGESVSARTDVYSLGLIGYELFTRQKPIVAENSIEALYKQLNEELPLVTAKNPNINESLATIIKVASDKNPLARYADAEEMLVTFQRTLGAKRNTAVADTKNTPAKAPENSNQFAAILLIGFLISGLALTTYLALKGGEVEDSKYDSGKTISLSNTESISEKESASAKSRKSTSISIDANLSTRDYASSSTSSTEVESLSMLSTSSSTNALVNPQIITPKTITLPSPTSNAEQSEVAEQSDIKKTVQATLRIRDTAQSTFSTSFPKSARSRLRWVGTISNYDASSKAAGEITGEFRLSISSLGQPAGLSANCSLAILALTAEIDNSIRLGGELDCARDLESGSYKLILSQNDNTIGELEFSIGN